MKKLVITSLLIALIPTCSQGAVGDPSTLNFTTGSIGSGPFIFDTAGNGGGALPFGTGANAFMAQVYAGPDANNLAAVGNAQVIGNAASTLFNGLVTAGTTINVTTVGSVDNGGTEVGGTGSYQIRAWSGGHSSYDAAVSAGANVGSSDVVNGFQFGLPGTPGNQVTTFTSFSLVPEPGTITLGLLGLGGLIASRRRKNA